MHEFKWSLNKKEKKEGIWNQQMCLDKTIGKMWNFIKTTEEEREKECLFNGTVCRVVIHLYNNFLYDAQDKSTGVRKKKYKMNEYMLCIYYAYLSLPLVVHMYELKGRVRAFLGKLRSVTKRQNGTQNALGNLEK